MSLVSELKQRGILFQSTDEAALSKALQSPVVFYCGFDPTSSSLHVGSMLPLVTMRRLQLAGHRPIVVVGGATGMIGDPSGKTTERVLMTPDVIAANIEGIKKSVSRFLSFEGPAAAIIVNNYDWTGSISYIHFLREIGKHFTINHMMAKESVRARLEDREHGISYTEFSYMLLQAFDFAHLADKMGCTLQIGAQTSGATSLRVSSSRAGCAHTRSRSSTHTCMALPFPSSLKQMVKSSVNPNPEQSGSMRKKQARISSISFFSKLPTAMSSS